MGKKEEQVQFKKGKSWFNLVGVAKVNDYTFTTDVTSEKSGYIYSRVNLGVETKEGNVVYAELMGGYFPNNMDNKGNLRENLIYVNSKEDFSNTYTIGWEDRHNEEILKTVHDNNFIKIGLEQYEQGGNTKTYTKRFLSSYDAINYIQENLEDGMVVTIRGNLKYSMYNDEIQVKREISSIFLSKAEPDKYRATFVQSILIDKDSIGKLDRDTNEYLVSARVVDYIKEYNDTLIKKNIPLPINYAIKLNEDKPELTKKMLTKFFKVKKGVTEIAIEGEFVNGVQTKEVTADDIPDDMKELIEMGLYTEEEIVGKLVVNGDRVYKTYITRPYIVKKDDSLQWFVEPEKYKEEDLILDFMYQDNEEGTDYNEIPLDEDDTAWLEELD